MNVRRTVATVVAALALVPLVGCSEDEPTEAAPSSEPTASSPPAPTTRSTPSTLAPGEEGFPEEALEDPTLAIEQWIKAMVDLQHGLGAEKFLRLSAEGCRFCDSFIQRTEELHGAGGRITGGDLTVHSITARSVKGQYTYVAEVTADPGTLLRDSGTAAETLPGGDDTYYIRVVLTDDGWRVESFRTET